MTTGAIEAGAETRGESPVPSALDAALERLQKVREWLRDGTLIENEDYGVIPGTGTKPTLLKPGAQKLIGLFCICSTIKEINRVWKDDLVAYEVTVVLLSKETNSIEGEGVGTCNSRERRYKNQDQYNIANTLLKMAEKRALVDATLNALGISSLFTQDLEDMAANDALPRDNGSRNGQARPQTQQQAQQQAHQQARQQTAVADRLTQEQKSAIEATAQKVFGQENWGPPLVAEAKQIGLDGTWNISKEGAQRLIERLRQLLPEEPEAATPEQSAPQTPPQNALQSPEMATEDDLRIYEQMRVAATDMGLTPTGALVLGQATKKVFEHRRQLLDQMIRDFQEVEMANVEAGMQAAVA